MKKTIFILAVVLTLISCGGKNYRNTRGGIIVDDKFTITAITDDIIRISNHTDDKFPENDCKFSVEETENEVTFSTSSIKAIVNVSDCTFKYFGADGRELNGGKLFVNDNITLSTDNWGEIKDGEDIYKITGKNMDSVVSSIRYLTGGVSIPPKWAMGYWQTADAKTLSEYREKHVSIDNIICQNGEIDDIHNLNGHLADSSGKADALISDTDFRFSGPQRTGRIYRHNVPNSWQGLENEITEGPIRSVTGNPYWATTPKDGDPELVERWNQFSAFLPIFTNFSTGVPDSHYNKLRYSLIPYIYTLCGKARIEGYTPTRPLAMEFPEDTMTYAVKDQYMLGPSLMVCPVYKKGERQRKVYLPAGRIWYDYNHPSKIYQGGTTIITEAPLNRIPVFVPAGAILAIGQKSEYVGEIRKNDRVDLDIDIYAGQDGHFEIYDDDGVYSSYSIVPVTFTEAPRTIVIEPRQGEYRGMLKARNVHVAVYDNGKMKAINVYYEGQRIKISL